MALKLYFATSKHQLPAGTVESCTFVTEPDIVVTLGIRNPTNGAVSKINAKKRETGTSRIFQSPSSTICPSAVTATLIWAPFFVAVPCQELSQPLRR